MTEINAEFPLTNRTWQIIHDAKEYGYAVGGFCVYNTAGILAVIDAAETLSSPTIIQFFPWTLHFQGPTFIEFAARRAHAASVPIALHLDHCTEPADAELALTCPFDSLMVDMSHLGKDENLRHVRSIVERARARNMTVEAELGRMVGSEDGVPRTDEEELTEPGDAKAFVETTGVHFLAPSFGNYHGPYPEGGAERWWQLDRLARIREAVGPEVPLVLHGTHPLSNEMLLKGMGAGMVKINQNRNVRDEYHAFVEENCGKMDLTKLQEGAVKAYSQGVQRMMLILGSDGKA